MRVGLASTKKMLLTSLSLLVISVTSHAWSSTIFNETDTCSGCVCASKFEYQDAQKDDGLLLESSVPEQRLDSGTHTSSQGDGQSATHASSRFLSGSGDSHSSSPWWDEVYDKKHLEAWVIMSLVMVTLVFDMTLHKLKHLASHEGNVSLTAHMEKEHHHHAHGHHVHTHSLEEELHHRASTELAVLGFLALSVWICNQAGLFEHLGEQDYSFEGLKLPNSQDDYLHTVEDIHIHLFVTMCVYFFFLFIIVKMANIGFRKAKNTNNEIKLAYQNGTITPETGVEYFSKRGSFRSAFFLFREYYFLSLQEWLTDWEFLDEHVDYILQDLKQDANFYGVKVDVEGFQDVKSVNIPALMRTWFPFELYFTISYRKLMDEMIEVKWTTWVAFVFFLLVQALVIRSVKEDIQFEVIWSVTLQVLIGMMMLSLLYFWREAKKVVHRDKFNWQLPNMKWIHRIHPVASVARGVQVGCFFTIYALTGGIISNVEWRRHPERNIVDVIILICGGMAETLLVGIVLPMYSLLMSTGPCMQEEHVIHMTTIVKLMSKNIKSKGKGARNELLNLGHNVEKFEEQADAVEYEVIQHTTTVRKQISPGQEDNEPAHGNAAEVASIPPLLPPPPSNGANPEDVKMEDQVVVDEPLHRVQDTVVVHAEAPVSMESMDSKAVVPSEDDVDIDRKGVMRMGPFECC